MRPQNPFIDDLQLNEEGELSDKQVRLLRRMFWVRIVTAGILCILAFLMGNWAFERFITHGGRTPVVYYGLILLILLMALFFVYGLFLLHGVARVWRSASTATMRKTVGVPTKHQRGTPLLLPSIFEETKQRLHYGWVEIGDAPFGVLPSALYDAIVNYEYATFYYISLRTFGFRRYLIVNYKPQT